MLDSCNYLFEASIAQAITATANISSIIARMTSDILSLEKKVSRFDGQIHLLNKVYVWSLAIALVAGLVSFMAQRQTIITSRRLAGVKAEVATSKEEELQRDLKEKEKQIADTNERAEHLAKDAEEARLKFAQLQSVVAWRTIEEPQFSAFRQILAERLSAITLITIANDPEATFFTVVISKGFKGWRLASMSRSYGGLLVLGVTILGKPGDDLERARRAFRAANIPFSNGPMPLHPFIDTLLTGDDKEANVTIVVGSKQRPELTDAPR